MAVTMRCGDMRRHGKFKDAEELVDGLPFQARVDRGVVRVASIDPDIEKSIRLGYIQGQNQVAIRARHLNGASPAVAVRDFIEKGFERGAFDRLVELVDFPVRRFRLFLPTAPQIFQMFRTDELFRDELESLLVIDADVYGDHDPNKQIAPHVTVMDLLKVQRYFNFISCLYQRKLEAVSEEADRAYLTFTSTIPVVPHDRFFEQMQLIFDNEAKSRAIIDLRVKMGRSPSRPPIYVVGRSRILLCDRAARSGCLEPGPQCHRVERVALVRPGLGRPHDEGSHRGLRLCRLQGPF